MYRSLLLVSETNDPGNRIRDGLLSVLGEQPLAVARDESVALAAIVDSDILFAFSPSVTPTVVRKAECLRWIQLLGSGIDGVLDATSGRPGILVTNGRGAQAAPVSEAVIALMLALARDLPRVLENQARREWQRWPARLLKGSTATIVGVGAIAEALAPKCAAFGMRVIGVSSAPRSVSGFEAVVPFSKLSCTLSSADYVVLLTPLTAATRHLVDRAAISSMRRSAYLVNAARGAVVDEVALADALQRGEIAGAALDVFEQEPLPPSSPLWSAPNTIVSPHLAGLNENYAAELLPILEENLRAFLRGERAGMRNLVAPV